MIWQQPMGNVQQLKNVTKYLAQLMYALCISKYYVRGGTARRAGGICINYHNAVRNKYSYYYHYSNIFYNVCAF